MKTYLITHIKSKKEMLFKYTLKGVLSEFKLNFKPVSKFYDLLDPSFPFTTQGIEAFEKNKNYRVKQLKIDLSFQAFWEAYGYKHGNKKRAKMIWESFDDVKRAKAIAYIPTYKSMLISSRKEHLYPETYLSQERFNNE